MGNGGIGRALLAVLMLAVWPVLAMAQGACVPVQGGTAAEARLLDWVNRTRAAYGVAALEPSAALRAAAWAHACDMAMHGFFDHQRPGGPDLRGRIAAQGYAMQAAHENLAFTRRLDAGVVAQIWQGSPPHREGLLRGDLRHAGLAVAKGSGRLWWVLVMAR
ncbi:MAG: CAP domain-containing protein [Gemmobacter sp.]|uniref:CAP domain-containing protein n=1 Tax=Gemmobacter sp. TaxID=1898957 RepID=UPI00391A7175